MEVLYTAGNPLNERLSEFPFELDGSVMYNDRWRVGMVLSAYDKARSFILRARDSGDGPSSKPVRDAISLYITDCDPEYSFIAAHRDDPELLAEVFEFDRRKRLASLSSYRPAFVHTLSRGDPRVDTLRNDLANNLFAMSRGSGDLHEGFPVSLDGVGSVDDLQVALVAASKNGVSVA